MLVEMLAVCRLDDRRILRLEVLTALQIQDPGVPPGGMFQLTVILMLGTAYLHLCTKAHTVFFGGTSRPKLA